MSFNIDTGVSNSKTRALDDKQQSASERFAGAHATHDVDKNLKSAAENTGGELREGVNGPASWLSQKMGLSSGDLNPRATVTRPDGVLVTSETPLDGRRYSDRPEGLDQFGGEESERNRVQVEDNEVRRFEPAGMARYKDRPEGIDQFGGEEAEREK
ncbi:hypothetical protein M0805_009723 [Coniferiporia weirii]|nr:hypothetical protein M0805_009723 [Coniferiporia weirii]